MAVVGHGAALAGFVTEIMTGSPFLWREWLLDNAEFYVIEVEFCSDKPFGRSTVKFTLSYIGKQMDMASENKVREEG